MGGAGSAIPGSRSISSGVLETSAVRRGGLLYPAFQCLTPFMFAPDNSCGGLHNDKQEVCDAEDPCPLRPPVLARYIGSGPFPSWPTPVTFPVPLSWSRALERT